MNIPQDLRFTIGGFSPKRMAYALSAFSLVLVPVHSRVPCEASEALGGVALMLAFITGVLCWLIPRDAPHRLLPRVFALVAFLAHLASIH
jgi:hypothetical protein